MPPSTSGEIAAKLAQGSVNRKKAFSVLETSTLKQIQFVPADKSHLVDRMQVK